MAPTPRQTIGARVPLSLDGTPAAGAQEEVTDGNRKRRSSSRSAAASSPRIENSIAVVGRRANVNSAAERLDETAGRGGLSHAEQAEFLEGLTRRYAQVGKRMYLPEGELAYIDRGRVLQTQLENRQVIADMVTLHRIRGATSLVVAGSERFRREAWLQATEAGLEVRGYRPTAQEAQLRGLGDRRPESTPDSSPSQTAEPKPPESRSPSSPSAWVEAAELERLQTHKVLDPRTVTGRLLEHGEAHYQFDGRKPRSYFVKLQTEEGPVVQWGADLGRAVRQSLSGVRIGDEAVIRHLGEKPVLVTRPVRGEDGDVVRQADVKAWLNQWSVERADFIQDRAQMAALIRDPSIEAFMALRQRPELAGTYDEIRIAREAAPQLYTDRIDQQRFVARLRTALADEIQRGEPLSATRRLARGNAPAPEEPRVRRQAQERVLS